MGGSSDPGEVMGSLFADASGARIAAAAAAAAAGLTVQRPAGARIDRKSNTVTFSGSSVHLAVVASPTRAANRFEVAGLVDPTVIARAGARVPVALSTLTRPALAAWRSPPGRVVVDANDHRPGRVFRLCHLVSR